MSIKNSKIGTPVPKIINPQFIVDIERDRHGREVWLRCTHNGWQYSTIAVHNAYEAMQLIKALQEVIEEEFLADYIQSDDYIDNIK